MNMNSDRGIAFLPGLILVGALIYVAALVIRELVPTPATRLDDIDTITTPGDSWPPGRANPGGMGAPGGGIGPTGGATFRLSCLSEDNDEVPSVNVGGEVRAAIGAGSGWGDCRAQVDFDCSNPSAPRPTGAKIMMWSYPKAGTGGKQSQYREFRFRYSVQPDAPGFRLYGESDWAASAPVHNPETGLMEALLIAPKTPQPIGNTQNYGYRVVVDLVYDIEHRRDHTFTMSYPLHPDTCPTYLAGS